MDASVNFRTPDSTSLFLSLCRFGTQHNQSIFYQREAILCSILNTALVSRVYQLDWVDVQNGTDSTSSTAYSQQEGADLPSCSS